MDEVVQWLRRPETFGDGASSVEVVETHISWVFLTERFAYKLKKPVRFDFLDFSTIDKRQSACEDELRLNRRLASAVYLGVVAIRRSRASELFLDESGLAPSSLAADRQSSPAVDWLVKMRRLPRDRTLDQLATAGRLAEEDIGRLAERLAEFYRRANPACISPDEYHSEFERHVRSNREILVGHALRAGNRGTALLSRQGSSEDLPHDGETSLPNSPGGSGEPSYCARRVHGAQLLALALAPELFDSRLAAGRVVDGHGDLRPEHIYLLSEPVVIDCIEFNAEFRHLDVADELSFLASECDYRGIGEAGRRIAERCLAAIGDHPPAELMAFYRSYRACVRAKVAVLRSRQLAGADRDRNIAEASDHLRWADRYASEMGQLAKPLVVVIHGLMGSGKSTLAAAVAERLGTTHLQTDGIRREMFGTSDQPAGYLAGLYQPEPRQAVYSRMFEIAEEQLRERNSIVLDGTFLKQSQRHEAAELAARKGARVLAVHCVCPPDIALTRLAKRSNKGGAASEARPDLYARQRADEETAATDVEFIEVDSAYPLGEQITSVIVKLRQIVAS